MHILEMAFQSAWKVLLTSVVLGAGIPAIFAVGIRGLAAGNGMLTTTDERKPMGKIVAAVCFLIVIAAVALGLAIIIGSGFGKVLSFEHIIPTLVDKKK